jgi:hypothetical protein
MSLREVLERKTRKIVETSNQLHADDLDFGFFTPEDIDVDNQQRNLALVGRMRNLNPNLFDRNLVPMITSMLPSAAPGALMFHRQSKEYAKIISTIDRFVDYLNLFTQALNVAKKIQSITQSMRMTDVQVADHLRTIEAMQLYERNKDNYPQKPQTLTREVAEQIKRTSERLYNLSKQVSKIFAQFIETEWLYTMVDSIWFQNENKYDDDDYADEFIPALDNLKDRLLFIREMSRVFSSLRFEDLDEYKTWIQELNSRLLSFHMFIGQHIVAMLYTTFSLMPFRNEYQTLFEIRHPLSPPPELEPAFPTFFDGPN